MNKIIKKKNWFFFGENVKVKLDLSHYTTKTDLGKAAGVDTSDFAKNTDLHN